MIKGIYNSASAMIPRVRQQEVIANNIANVGSAGFKKDSIFVSELTKAQRKRIPTKSDWERPMLDQVYTDYSQGSLDRTGASLDVALDGKGFFVVQTPDGEEMLTRNGALSTDESGFLVTPGGALAMGDGGPIQLPVGEVAIAEDGTISVDGETVASLRVATVEDPTKLEKVGASLFKLPDGVELQAAVGYVIRQGYLESANVDVITQMVEMISSYRNYEADAQALKGQDESLEKLISELGRPI